MDIENYFPTGIVTGSGFCNREAERALLKKRLEQNAHIVLVSPRRYGKSSLVAQFTLDQKIPFASVDLLPATSSKYVRNAIVDGVTSLIDCIMPHPKKAKAKLLSYFSTMNPVIELSAFGQRMKLTPLEKTPEETIMKLLLSLDKAATDLNRRLIFVMDEFQQISNLDNPHALEASIRHAVERSKKVFYVFSGSNRTLLEGMFKDKGRPLYHLCDEVKINRISKESYHAFIAKAAKANWGEGINSESIDKILLFTEHHPYYVNRLCRILWDSNMPPNEDEIEQTWSEYVEEQNVDWASDMISRLTVNQRAILAALAREPEAEPQSKNFTNKLEMSASSIQRTISTLLRKDHIYKDKNGRYCVLNPVVKTILYSDSYFGM